MARGKLKRRDIYLYLHVIRPNRELTVLPAKGVHIDLQSVAGISGENPLQAQRRGDP